MSFPSKHENELQVFKKTSEVLREVTDGRDVSELVATIRYLQERDGDVTQSALQEALSNPLPTRECLRLTRHLKQYQYTGGEALTRRTRALHHIETHVQLQQANTNQPETSLLATLPDDDAIDAGSFDNLLTELMEMIKTAETHLWLISPYLSEPAFERLQPALHTAVDRGASISVLTRYLTYGNDDYEFNRTFARCISDDSQISPQLKLYEYVNDETWDTFHAKVVIADRKQAYLGTANVTGTGFMTNLELGVLFKNETVNDLAGVFDSLRNSDYLHEVERVGEGFIRRDTV